MIADVQIRAGTVEDVRAIVALLKDVALEGRWVRTQWPFDVLARESDLRTAIAKARVLCLVAEHSGEIVGQIALFPIGLTAQFGMFIAKSARAKGLGRILLGAGEDAARQHGLEVLELEVYAHNDAAIALYTAFGFEEFGNRRPERRNSGEIFEVVNMRKRLR